MKRKHESGGFADDPQASPIVSYLGECRRDRWRAANGIVVTENDPDEPAKTLNKWAREALEDAREHPHWARLLLRACAEHMEHGESLPDVWREWLASALLSAASEECPADRALCLVGSSGTRDPIGIDRGIFAMEALRVAYGLSIHGAALVMEELGGVTYSALKKRHKKRPRTARAAEWAVTPPWGDPERYLPADRPTIEKIIGRIFPNGY